MAAKDSDPRYDVGDEIAKGGMGEVKDARDLHLDRPVAMKVIRAERDGSRDIKQRFVQEARILAQLEHPNIIPIHDLDKDEQGRVFYTMKKVQGMDLKQVLDGVRDGDAEVLAKHSLNQLLNVFQKVCDAMAYAHSRGIIHRDLKPENIMLGEFGEVWVMDWGLAKVLADGHLGPEGQIHVPGGDSESDSGVDPTLTMDGAVMGTPQFMAPEQAEGRIADQDERTDVFALGGLLYSILTLRAPTSGSSLEEILDNIKSGYIPPPAIYNKSKKLLPGGMEADAPIELKHCPGGKAPEALSAVTMTAMEVEAENRYQTVEELQAEVRAFQGGFATSVEEAGALRQLVLYVRRNRTFSAMAAVISILMLGSLVTVIRMEMRTRNALEKFNASEPLIEADVASKLGERDYEGALTDIEQLLIIKPDSVKFWNQKGNIQLAQLEIAEAADAYRETLKREDGHAYSMASLKLCLALLGDDSAGDLGEVEFKQLAELMEGQGRFAEAAAFRNRLSLDLTDKTQELEDYRAILIERGVSEYRASRLTRATQGLKLHLEGDKTLISLEKFAGIPLHNLRVDSPKFKDLGALRGMPLKDLYLRYTAVSDLSPLKGLELRSLVLRECAKVTDLGPLAGMPLTNLDISITSWGDLSPLKGMPLVNLEIGGNNLTNLTFLEGTPLQRLSAYHVGNLKDLRPLQTLPLRQLILYGSAAEDLSPLEGLQLEGLNLSSSKVRDISPLRGMPLRALTLSSCMVESVGVLEGMPLNELHLNGCLELRDISALRGAPLETLDLTASLVDNISVVEGMPLIRFWADYIPATDFEPLRGLKLQSARLSGAPIADFSIFEGMPLQSLYLTDCKTLRDVSPLVKLPLVELRLSGCNPSLDVGPLAECAKLERLTVPLGAKGIEKLRNHPTLKKIAYKVAASAFGDWSPVPDIAEFWKAYDARKKR
jgi:serine/threonine protein kinase/Leucine-rich repeat (LRR) protein